MFHATRNRAGLSALLFAFFCLPARADDGLSTVVVTGHPDDLPGPAESISAAQAREQINAVNTEDMLKYLPSLTVRKRHYGDTQDPLATRTSGVGASARSLLFVDGILVSSPIGNNNTSASPHFGIAAPQDVQAIEVLYGPFAAEYGGGSIGAVLNIVTAMPDKFALYADALGAVQNFNQYATHDVYTTWQTAGGIGDRDGAFSWRLSANHLDSFGQPLAYVTQPRPAAAGSAGTPVTGAIAARNRTAMPIAIIGTGASEHQVQDTDTLKLAYDLPHGWALSYTASVFHQQDDAAAQSYLRDDAGAPVTAGSVNIGGYNYAIPASVFAINIYAWKQTHLAQGLSLRSNAQSVFAWEVVASRYDYIIDKQRVPASVSAQGPGTINRLDGTGWTTLDAKGVWRGWTDHAVSFGLHRDQENFAQDKDNTTDWRGGAPSGTASIARGRTATNALWLQDIWHFAPGLRAIIGGRYEDWRAYDGYNYSASPALNVIQPKLSTGAFSPKAALEYRPGQAWTLSASFGSAYRMPTVTELYQAITTGTQLTVPNPDLKPEHANSYEAAAEYENDGGRLRLSLFQEDVAHALLAQSAPLLAGSSTLYSYVQNVDRTRVRGAELVVDQNDVLIPGLELSGSVTYADGRTMKDSAFAAAVGKALPQLPRWRGSLAATYRPDDRWAYTLAARYSDKSFGTIDNSDTVSQTFQGFARYLVLDARVHYALDQNWSAALGVDNFNNDKYFVYHPFPQRTFVMELHYAQ